MTVHSKGWIPHFENLWLDVSRLESTKYEEKGQNMFDYKVKCDESWKKESKCLRTLCFILLSKWSHLLWQVGIGDHWLELNNFLHYHTQTAD